METLRWLIRLQHCKAVCLSVPSCYTNMIMHHSKTCGESCFSKTSCFARGCKFPQSIHKALRGPVIWQRRSPQKTLESSESYSISGEHAEAGLHCFPEVIPPLFTILFLYFCFWTHSTPAITYVFLLWTDLHTSQWTSYLLSGLSTCIWNMTRKLFQKISLWLLKTGLYQPTSPTCTQEYWRVRITWYLII